MADQIKNNNCAYYHVMPGRVRLGVDNLKSNKEAAKSLEVLMSSQPGIKSAKANPVTGNVLVCFDKEIITHEEVLQNLMDLGHYPMISTDQYEDNQMQEYSFTDIGIMVGKHIAKAALKQAFRGTPAAFIIDIF